MVTHAFHPIDREAAARQLCKFKANLGNMLDPHLKVLFLNKRNKDRNM